MSYDARRALLLASGYELRFREETWVECLLLREDEAWLGRGRDRASALEAAIRAACPSRLARELFDQALARAAAVAAMKTLAGDEGAAETIELARTAMEVLQSVAAPPVSHLASAVLPASASSAVSAVSASNGAGEHAEGGGTIDAHRADASMVPTAPAAPSEAREARGDNGVPPAAIDSARENGLQAGLTARAAPPRTPAPRSHSSPPPLVRRDAMVMPRMDPPRALEELDILMERIRDSREELGLCSPERQRLAMLAWICEARAHTDAFPEDMRIRDRVGSISRQLTEIGKTFWPGSVTALQLQMQPRDLPRHVLGGPASTWSRAAELAERALRSLEYTDERRGFDAYGWSDATYTHPGPGDPGELLDRLGAEVERFGGLLTHHAVPREIDVRPDPDEYRRWIRTLRWLRCSDVDPERWARIAGRLRWWACHREAPLAAAARELDAGFMPEQPWAKELGEEPSNGDASAQKTGDLPQLAARSLPEHLFESIRAAMSGKRMVFVSNRRDPDLQTRLKDALPSATLDWRVAEPKRLEALGEAIQQGAYDVVLGAIGLQSQGTDHLLARACKQAGVKYIRVNRGRPMVCLRALARDLHSTGP